MTNAGSCTSCLQQRPWLLAPLTQAQHAPPRWPALRRQQRRQKDCPRSITKANSNVPTADHRLIAPGEGGQPPSPQLRSVKYRLKRVWDVRRVISVIGDPRNVAEQMDDPSVVSYALRRLWKIVRKESGTRSPEAAAAAARNGGALAQLLAGAESRRAAWSPEDQAVVAQQLRGLHSAGVDGEDVQQLLYSLGDGAVGSELPPLEGKSAPRKLPATAKSRKHDGSESATAVPVTNDASQKQAAAAAAPSLRKQLRNVKTVRSFFRVVSDPRHGEADWADAGNVKSALKHMTGRVLRAQKFTQENGKKPSGGDADDVRGSDAFKQLLQRTEANATAWSREERDDVAEQLRGVDAAGIGGREVQQVLSSLQGAPTGAAA